MTTNLLECLNDKERKQRKRWLVLGFLTWGLTILFATRIVFQIHTLPEFSMLQFIGAMAACFVGGLFFYYRAYCKHGRILLNIAVALTSAGLMKQISVLARNPLGMESIDGWLFIVSDVVWLFLSYQLLGINKKIRKYQKVSQEIERTNP